MITSHLTLFAAFILIICPPAFGDSSNPTEKKCADVKIDKLIEELNSITSVPLTEWSGERSGELVDELGECRDPRSIPALLNILGVAGGSLVVDAFAKMGSPIIEPLITKSKDQDKDIRSDAIFYLGRIPGKFSQFGHRLSTKNHIIIKKAIKQATRDEDELIRQRANTALEQIRK